MCHWALSPVRRACGPPCWVLDFFSTPSAVLFGTPCPWDTIFLCPQSPYCLVLSQFSYFRGSVRHMLSLATIFGTPCLSFLNTGGAAPLPAPSSPALIWLEAPLCRACCGPLSKGLCSLLDSFLGHPVAHYGILASLLILPRSLPLITAFLSTFSAVVASQL